MRKTEVEINKKSTSFRHVTSDLLIISALSNAFMQLVG